MWDVAWTDPNRELVGQHRAKRDHDKDEGGQDRTLARNSISTASSKGSARSAFSRFRPKPSRQSPSSIGSLERDGPAPAELSTSHKIKTVPALSHLEMDIGGTEVLNERRMSRSNPDISRASLETAANEVASSGSITKRTSILKNKVLCDQARPAAAASSAPIIAHDTVSNNHGSHQEQAADTEQDCLYSIPQSAVENVNNTPERPLNQQAPITQSFASENSQQAQSPSRLKPRLSPLKSSNDLGVLVPPARSPLRPSPYSSVRPIPMNDVSSWRKPTDWKQNKAALGTVQKPESVSRLDVNNSTIMPCSRIVPSFPTLEVEARNMARAGPLLALSELQKCQKCAVGLDIQDELEEKKKWWMLSVLHHLDQKAPFNLCGRQTEGQDSGHLQQPREKVMAVFQPKFSADYLAALWPEKAVYHLPNGPLSFPTELSATERHNPTIASQLNESTSLFDAAYSMSLPSLCDVGQIEAVVSKISRSLKARGVLNLILIDPTPNVGALGERLRTWLLENLLLNLERNSRCLYPSILLPHLLGAASLRGPGSTLVKARFYANPQNIGRHGEKETSADKEVRRDEEIRAELRSTVGCMLWREVWGGFVTSDTWWWDDAACMQECLERGTFWEYYFIRAIKPD